MKKYNLITATILAAGLVGCGVQNTQTSAVAKTSVSAPGAPGEAPFWAYAGKTGIGTSFEQYQNGHYSDEAPTGKVSKVWFSIAKGMITETMFGLIHQAQIKEIKFRPGTDEGDYQVKLRNLRKFLEAGDKAKITIRFRGREMAHQEIGIELLNRIKTDLEELAVVESFPNRVEGRQMVMMMAPVAKK